MLTREAVEEDASRLQELQARCPMGVGLVVSTINKPDFFARARAYRAAKVFCACDEQGRIVGSAACAVRPASVGGRVVPVGYQFQYFVDPERRRSGVAARLYDATAAHLKAQGTELNYCLLLEDNVPSRKFFEQRGFRAERKLTILYLPAFRRYRVGGDGRVRSATAADLPQVAALMNATWSGHELYHPVTPDELEEQLARTRGHGVENLLLFEAGGRVRAALGYWDWNQVTEVSVVSLDAKLTWMSRGLSVLSLLFNVPKVPAAGQPLRQWCITPLGYEDKAALGQLLRELNNRALDADIAQVALLATRGHPVLEAADGMFRVSVAEDLYVQSAGAHLASGPVFVDGADL